MYLFVFLLAFCCSLAESKAGSDETARETECCQADEHADWSYRGKSNGPDFWQRRHKACRGLQQSPIEVGCKISSSRTCPPAYFSRHNPIHRPIITNDGHTISLRAQDNGQRWHYINYEWYCLSAIHFHFGLEKDDGSEHIIDGQRYAMEIHGVLRRDKKILVVAIFCKEVHDFCHPELAHVVNCLPKVMYRNTSTIYPYDFNFLNLLPENPAAHYTYQGSLTTPDCRENVTWVLLKKPILVGHDQMCAFRRPFSSHQKDAETGCKLAPNCRPIQPLHNRPVYESWEPQKTTTSTEPTYYDY